MVLLFPCSLKLRWGPLSISQWLAEQTILSFVLPVVRVFIARPSSFISGNLIFLGEPELLELVQDPEQARLSVSTTGQQLCWITSLNLWLMEASRTWLSLLSCLFKTMTFSMSSTSKVSCLLHSPRTAAHSILQLHLSVCDRFLQPFASTGDHELKHIIVTLLLGVS